jgi:hypothetical protein
VSEFAVTCVLAKSDPETELTSNKNIHKQMIERANACLEDLYLPRVELKGYYLDATPQVDQLAA